MRIALVTCEHPIERDDDLDFLIPALTRAGAEVEAPPWSKSRVDWASFDVAMLSSTRDYHERIGEFRKWLRATAKLTRLRNSVELVDWNLDKRYLLELEAAGVPVIPTVWTDPGETETAITEIEAEGWGDLIIKPVVDLGARNLVRVPAERGRAMLERYDAPTMIQPYLPSVAATGEIGLVYAGGEFSHALRKLPARGDFRIQPQYGGTHEPLEATNEMLELGARSLAVAPGPEPLYARLDLVTLDDGSSAVIELELIEPALYLDVEPTSAVRLARALLAEAA